MEWEEAEKIKAENEEWDEPGGEEMRKDAKREKGTALPGTLVAPTFSFLLKINFMNIFGEVVGLAPYVMFSVTRLR